MVDMQQTECRQQKVLNGQGKRRCCDSHGYGRLQQTAERDNRCHIYTKHITRDSACIRDKTDDNIGTTKSSYIKNKII